MTCTHSGLMSVVAGFAGQRQTGHSGGDHSAGGAGDAMEQPGTTALFSKSPLPSLPAFNAVLVNWNIITGFGRFVTYSCLECYIYLREFTYIFSSSRNLLSSYGPEQECCAMQHRFSVKQILCRLCRGPVHIHILPDALADLSL